METGIEDLASDFTLAQTFTAEQVLSLEKEFTELSERIKEELPLILNSYLEVASDAKGKRSLTEKFIRSAVDTFADEVNNSNAWIFYSSLIKFNIQSRGKVHYRSLVGRVAEMILADSKYFDFLSFIENATKVHRITYLFSSFPWSSNKLQSSGATREIAEAIKISKKDLVGVCKSKKEEGELAKCLDQLPNDKILVNYFSDPFDLKIIEALDRNVEAKAAMMGAFAAYLIANIRDLRGEPAAKLKLSSEGFDLSFKEEVSYNINIIIERCIARTLDHHISEASKEVEAFSVGKNKEEWAKLQKAINLFVRSLIHTGGSHDIQMALKLYLGDQEELILEEIFSFLSNNSLNPCNIPTIAELGKHKGGYALVKSISDAGGLKSIRKKYVPWSIKKTRDLEERKRESKGYRRNEEKIMSLYSSEAADPGSTGVNMSLNEISDLMDSEFE